MMRKYLYFIIGLKVKNNIIDEIRKINGKSLYINVGTFKKVNDKGTKNPTA